MTMAEREEELRMLASQKGRSASICAPGFSSMETIMVVTSGSGTIRYEDGSNEGTPKGRRRPAARSQSARVVGAKPRVKRREGNTLQLESAGSEPRLPPGDEGSYNPFLRKVPSTGRLTAGVPPITTTSPSPVEPPSYLPLGPDVHSADLSPKLHRRGSAKPPIPVIATPEGSPAVTRKSLKSPSGRSPVRSPSGSTRRVNSMKSPRRSGYLDVPDDYHSPAADEDDESYRLRTFSVTSKGVVNRGDSFRRRRSRSNSLIPPNLELDGKKSATPPATPIATPAAQVTPSPEVITYRVAMIGAQGVGKTALISQFMTSECINAYDRQRDEPREQSVSIMLNGEESELWFINIDNSKLEMDKSNPPDAFVVMYSVIDKASLQRAEDELARLQDWDLLRSRPAILVGNKVDLARSRAISPQDGRCMACTYRAKFIEISVGINHNVDELLVGILNQIRLKLANAHMDKESSSHWYKSRGVVRASMKARQVFTWLFGKEDSKFKNCENLHTL